MSPFAQGSLDFSVIIFVMFDFSSFSCSPFSAKDRLEEFHLRFVGELKKIISQHAYESVNMTKAKC